MKIKCQKRSLAAQPHQNNQILQSSQDKFLGKQLKKSTSSASSENSNQTSKIKTTLDIYQQNIQIVNCVREGAVFRFDPSMTPPQKSFQTLQEEQKFKHRKIVAQTLINRDYGLILFREEVKLRNIKLKIDKVQYKTLSCGVATETFRKIEHFLLYMCERKIHSVQHQQLRCIFSILLHYRLHFQKEQAQTLVDFICLTYNIKEVTISQGRTCRLYSAIHQILKSKMASKLAKPLYNPKLKILRPFLFKNKESDAIHNLNKHWDDIHEDEMLEFYRNDQRFANMKTYFKQIHPNTAEHYTIASLKSQFYKILRVILKQIEVFLHKKDSKKFPEMIKIDAQRTKTIIRGPQGEHLRLKMLSIYKKTDVSYSTLTDLIKCLNQYVISRQAGAHISKWHYYKSYVRTPQIENGLPYLEENITFDDYLQATCDPECAI